MNHKKHKKQSKQKEHKSKHKHKEKSKKSRRRSSSRSDSSSSNDEEAVWVEKNAAEHDRTGANESAATTSKSEESLQREDWMSLNSLFPCVFNPDKKAARKKEEKQERSILDMPGQSSRELNPYWKDGGNGLPQVNAQKADTSRMLDAAWLRKSLQRAKEQSEKEGRSLEEIAVERWGSLETIQQMIVDAERKESRNNTHRSRYSDSSRMQHKSDNYSRSNVKYRDNRESIDDFKSSRSYNRDVSEKHGRYSSETKLRREPYKKPTDDDDYSSNLIRERKSTSSRNWQKNKPEKKNPDIEQLSIVEEENIISSTSSKNNESSNSEEAAPVTEAELNKLGAKIVKAEIMGDTELAAKLKIQLEKAREVSAKSVKESKPAGTENVVLSRINAKGVSRPIEPRTYSKDTSSSKKRKMDTHVSGERVRHYYDDDKYSLQQLFQREKGRSGNDDDAAFTKLVSKSMDMNDIFEEQIAQSRSDVKQDARERAAAINEHKRLTKSLENCRWCIDSSHMLKHMIIAMDSEICLSLPSHTSLTEGHCILSPVHHIACQLQLDEDIWEKLQVYKRALCKMFREQDKYPVFFEVYKNRYKFPHMQLECVPLPTEIGESAPMYFKKALLECETEWSINKKVIDLKDKDLRRAIPNGLSYFVVQFGMDRGYAHVIEDAQMFPSNFAEEIIGGMLDLDHDSWRKPRKDSFDQQREKTLRFSEQWKKYSIESKCEK